MHVNNAVSTAFNRNPIRNPIAERRVEVPTSRRRRDVPSSIVFKNFVCMEVAVEACVDRVIRTELIDEVRAINGHSIARIHWATRLQRGDVGEEKGLLVRHLSIGGLCEQKAHPFALVIVDVTVAGVHVLETGIDVEQVDEQAILMLIAIVTCTKSVLVLLYGYRILIAKAKVIGNVVRGKGLLKIQQFVPGHDVAHDPDESHSIHFTDGVHSHIECIRAIDFRQMWVTHYGETE
jgi:hypothetical protein